MTRFDLRAFVLAAAACACGASDNEGLGPPPTYPVPGCEHIDHRPCDVLGGACQERLMRLAACLRGSEPLPVPPITVMTEQEFADYLNAGIPENPPPEPNHYEVALTLFELALPGALSPASLVAEDVEFVWGFYRRNEKDVVLVDHGAAADDPDPNSVLVHELIHALQDADVDLGRLWDEYLTTFDSYLGLASVTEGEARLHQTRFWSSLMGLDPERIDWTQHFEEVVGFAEQAVLDHPSPYIATRAFFPYEFGARMVHHALREDGPAGVDRLFASPPLRSHAAMASVDGVATSDWPAPEFAPIEPAEGWELVAEASLGAWGEFLRAGQRSPLDVARRLALEWRGDELAVYVRSDPTVETAAVWRVEFVSDGAAAEAATLPLPPNTRVFHEGARLVLARTTRGSDLSWALVP